MHDFPHRCPGEGCAVCAFLQRKHQNACRLAQQARLVQVLREAAIRRWVIRKQKERGGADGPN